MEDYHRDVLQRWKKMINDGQMYEGEFPIRTVGGEVKWVWERCRGVVGEQKEILYVDGYIEDVTERKQAEESLRESEQRYFTFINSIDDFVFLKDEDFRYLFTNDANAAFFGKTMAEIVGLTDFDLMHPEMRVHAGGQTATYLVVLPWWSMKRMLMTGFMRPVSFRCL